MARSNWPLLQGRTRPLAMKEWGDLTVMDPAVGARPRGRGFLIAGNDCVHIDAGNSLENPVVSLYAGDDPGPESGWDEVEEITVVSTTGFLALCDSGYAPLYRKNLATAGAGPYLTRVHADGRSSDGVTPRFFIQIIPGERTGAETEPPARTIEQSGGPLVVRTSFGRSGAWARLLRALEDGSEHYESITVIDNPAYAGFAPEQIQARIGRDAANWPDNIVVLIADDQALAATDFPLLAVNTLPGDEDTPFRITLAAAGSFVANMELANTSFGDWARGVDVDGIYRAEHY